VFAYALTGAGAAMSSSPSTIELVPPDVGTLLRFPEHTAFFGDGNSSSAGRREGSLGLLEALAKELAAHVPGRM
jgi:hypothetical protein